MHLSRLALSACALAFAHVAPSHAVHVASEGQGQVLIFPYYTVNGGHSTLLSVNNHHDRAKALRITIREARHGARVLSFNIYLGAHDVWTAAIVPSAEGDAPAQIVSSDTTCAVPLLTNDGVPFRNDDYATGDPASVGSASLARTREGFIEVYETGELIDTGEFPAATFANDQHCSQLVNAWNSGPWGQAAAPVDPSRAIAPPSGGISGSAILVDAPNGSSFSYRATALQDFFRASDTCAAPCIGVAGEHLHTLPASLSPTLADARNAANGGSSARFHANGREYVYAFAGEGAGLKSVSAALMQQSVSNEFNSRVSSNLGARGEWVLTLPTRGLHIGAESPRLRHPFNPANGQPEGSCEPIGVNYRDRDGHGFTLFSIGTPPPNSHPNLPSLCHSSQVWSFNQSGQDDAASAPSSILGSRLNHNIRTCVERTLGVPGGCSQAMNIFPEGLAKVAANAPHQFLHTSAAPTSANGGDNVLLGLPILGVWITSFEATGQPGTLANFTVQQPHVAERGTASRTVTESGAGYHWQAGANP